MMGLKDGAEVSVSTKLIGDCQTIFFAGKLSYGRTQIVKEQMLKELVKTSKYILDMTQLKSIDSTGFGVLINLARVLRDGETKIVVIINDDDILEYFKMAQFHKIFPLVSNEEEATQFLNGNQPFDFSIDY